MEDDRLQLTMRVVEQACTAVQVPDAATRNAAEATLMAFRKSPHSIQACQYILGHSSMAMARFQAAAAMQEAAIRDWSLISSEEKDQLRTYCLHYVMVHAGGLEGYLQAKLLSVVAALLKRGWLEHSGTERDAFFQEVQQAIAGRHGLAAQRAGISLVEALISEFSPSTASPMGLSAEFHDQCRASLELNYLQKFYTWALDASVMVAGKAVEGHGDNLETVICTLAIRLMTQILNWEFQGNTSRGAGGVIILGKKRASSFLPSLSHEGAGRRLADHTYLGQLGATWHDILLSPDRIAWLLNLYSHLRQRGGDCLELPLAVVTRQLIVQLCSVNGNIFLADGGAEQEKHLQRLLSGIVTWIDPPENRISAIMAGGSESELLDGCRALLAIATVRGSPSSFDQLLKQSGTLQILASLTCEAFKAHVIEQDKESGWPEEVLNVLLETWTVLLQPAELNNRMQLPQSGADAAVTVFHTYVECELKVCEASVFDDDDPAEQASAAVEARDERLTAVALIARTAPSVTLPLLAMLISNCSSALRQSSGGDDVYRCRSLERLHWLVIMSGHVLADPGKGETPLVPDSIIALGADAKSHPAVVLSWSIIELAQQSLDETFRMRLLSPRLMEAIVWFLGRWVNTYLMAVDAGRGPNSTPSGHEGDRQVIGNLQFDGRTALNAAFGKDGGGMAILEVLLRVALTCLTAWEGEVTLQEQVCFELLPAFVRRRNICSDLLSLAPWQELASVFANQDKRLFSLPERIQRAISESLCRSVTGLPSSEAASQYVKDLLYPLIVSFTALSERSDLTTISQQPNVVHQVCCYLERLRGAARAASPQSQKGIFEIGTLAMKPLIRFLEVYKHQPSVIYLLLKFLVDWVDGQVAFLEPRETAMLFSFCVQLLGIYSTQNIGKVSISSSENLMSETQAEKYKDLRALLQLLTNLSTKDLIDFSAEGELENPDVAKVLYLGLSIITPLISLELLKFPKLCRHYFALIAHVLEVYPEQVAKLSPEGFSQIVNTLDFGLRHQDAEVVNWTLAALSALALYQYQAQCRGQGYLGQARHGGEGILEHFLKSLMQLLLFEDYSNELIDPAADALLPLILCNAALYQKLIHELLQGQQNPAARTRLTAAFHSLTNNNQLSMSVERANRRKFRENLYAFLNDVRAFLRTR